MKEPIPKPLISYIIILAGLFLVSAFILKLIVAEGIILIAILLFMFVTVCIVVYHLYASYIKPIDEVSEAMEQIAEGNYRARFFYNKKNKLGHLSEQINKLARHLTDYSLQEQMQSEQLSTLINNTESGLVLLDEKGYIHLVNPKFIDLFGKNEKDYVGSVYHDVLNNEIFLETIKKVFLYEKNIKESFKQDVGYERIYLEISGAPIINERNIFKGAVFVLHDITELKKLENMRKDFVANVSHELRTPVTSIRGFSETLLDENLEDKETATEFLKIIHKESYRLQQLIEDLLALSKLERDNFRLVLHKLNARELVDEIIPTFYHKAEAKKIELEIYIDEDVQIKADKERIKQVIINLLDNALNYTGEDGHVSLKIEEKENQVCIIVSDTGIGISAEELSRIFERFYRVDKARTRFSGGTGLGLAIVKHIVEVHNGEIKIDSEVNKGTEVKVLLPK